MGRRKGKLIVFEGIDGSGKNTQTTLLLKYLKSQKILHSFYSFPRYEKPWGKLIRRYLSGEFGEVNEVNPYLASALYAGDRLDASSSIKKDIKAGKFVICDRYVASNIAHQAAKLTTHSPREALAKRGHSPLITFMNWIEDFEYNQNRIPEEDLVILLSLPTNFAQKLMKRRKHDIHERDVTYLKRVGEVFEELARRKKNWVKIESVQNGKLLPPQKIHEKVILILKSKRIL